MPKPIGSSVVVTAAFLNDLVGVYHRNGTEIDVQNTTTETSIYSRTITGGHMSSDRWIRCTILADVLNNTGGNANSTLRLKFGATVWYGDLFTINTTATRYGTRLLIEIANLGSASLQFAFATVYYGATSAGSIAGVGDVSGGMDGSADWGTAAGAVSLMSNGTMAEATASDKLFDVTIQHSSASANLSFKKRAAISELC